MQAIPYFAAFFAGLTWMVAQPAIAQISTSDQCGVCHRDIYKMWRSSKHAEAMEDPAFLESFRKAQVEWGEDRSRVCLDCHAPMVAVTEDWDLTEKITWEGVNCDICHSLVDVNLSGHGPRMVLDFGAVKRGPIADAKSTEHEVAYSPLHEKSIACAACHEFTNAEGVPIMTTFSEWQRSQAAENGTTCQSCHMSRVKGDLVDPRVKRSKQAEVNLHEMPGGHSRSQLGKALDIGYNLQRTPDGIKALVRISNITGHAVPTGMPSREIVLTVQLDTPEAGNFEEQRIFGKSYLKADGKPIEYTWDFFEKGIRVDSDTRIAADSEWRETFHFAIPEDVTGYFKIRLDYQNAMAEMQYEATRFEFYSEQRTIKSESRRFR